MKTAMATLLFALSAAASGWAQVKPPPLPAQADGAPQPSVMCEGECPKCVWQCRHDAIEWSILDSWEYIGANWRHLWYGKPADINQTFSYGFDLINWKRTVDVAYSSCICTCMTRDHECNGTYYKDAHWVLKLSRLITSEEYKAGITAGVKATASASGSSSKGKKGKTTESGSETGGGVGLEGSVEGTYEVTVNVAVFWNFEEIKFTSTDCLCCMPTKPKDVPSGSTRPKPDDPKKTVDPKPDNKSGHAPGSTDPQKSDKHSKVHIGKDFEFSGRVTILDTRPERKTDDGTTPETTLIAVPIAGAATHAIIQLVRDGGSAHDITQTATAVRSGTNVFNVPGDHRNGAVVRTLLHTPEGARAGEATILGTEGGKTLVATDVPAGSRIDKVEVLKKQGSEYEVVHSYDARSYTWDLQLEPVRTVGVPLGGKLTISASEALAKSRFRFTLEALGPFNPPSGTAVVGPGVHDIASLVKIVPAKPGEYDINAALEPLP